MPTSAMTSQPMSFHFFSAIATSKSIDSTIGCTTVMATCTKIPKKQYMVTILSSFHSHRKIHETASDVSTVMSVSTKAPSDGPPRPSSSSSESLSASVSSPSVFVPSASPSPVSSLCRRSDSWRLKNRRKRDLLLGGWSAAAFSPSSPPYFSTSGSSRSSGRASRRPQSRYLLSRARRLSAGARSRQHRLNSHVYITTAMRPSAPPTDTR
mmetsp:Transcript_72277/g.227868  ORF Transcript_72277/g.227868 Transcript_72277/m.227868 type:complete len:210 (+) Transcript_72277:114-743(+)